ncbi:MAG: ABC transporter ATP-binding protein [Candidatus Nanoarchaeia archaeon]|nr:ABC transporter ATP-binding protein [Candidatus Nanoarchaeia archaeon]
MNKENDNIIELKDVSRYYKLGDTEIKALCDVNLQIKRGDFLAIVGPSGSGKSTMMNLVGALDLSTKGDILLDGQNIEHLEESELAQIRGKKIGFVFQTFNLIPTLNAMENIALPMIFHGISKKERMERAEKILEQVGLMHRKNHFPKELSGGERQRVAIGRALANEPEVILADEPTGNLDTKTGLEIMKLFVDLNKQGKTIILVTHNLDLIKYVQKVLKISDGRIIEHRKVKQRKII